MQYIRLLLFYSVIFQSVIFHSCKFQSPTVEANFNATEIHVWCQRRKMTTEPRILTDQITTDYHTLDHN